MQVCVRTVLSASVRDVNLPSMLACKKLWSILRRCLVCSRNPMMLGVSDNPRGQPKSSLVDDAYRALKEAIRENAFPPGYQGSQSVPGVVFRWRGADQRHRGRDHP